MNTIRWLAMCLLLLSASQSQAALSIASVKVDPISFNPLANESVRLSYRLNAAAKVRIRVYGPDYYLIRTLVNWEYRHAGCSTESWDGRDEKGRLVPDEAYFFCIEAKAGAKVSTYDPTEDSGGDELELGDLRYNLQTRQIVFTLQKPARVLVRAGIRNGPMMKTVVDWHPFGPGTHRVPWDGMDESNVVDAGSNPDLKLYGIGYSLPDASVIALGNSDLVYSKYVKTLPKNHPRKPAGRRSMRKVAISPFWGRPPQSCRAIDFELTSPTVSNGTLKATVTVVPDDALALRGIQYEIIVYADNVMIIEDERGYSPYPISIDVSKLGPGDHVLTVNIASVTDRIGSRSATFRLSP